jgi:hypothetical protein
MDCGARQLFIYYRVQSGRASDAIAAALRMQDDLRALHHGLLTSLLRRPATDAEPHVTLMETYAIDAAVAPQGVGAALQGAIERAAEAALGALIVDRRHVEVFDTCAS